MKPKKLKMTGVEAIIAINRKQVRLMKKIIAAMRAKKHCHKSHEFDDKKSIR